MLTLQQLITPPSEDEALTSILSILTQLGFEATAWQKGSIQLTILRLFARVWSGLATTIQQIAAGGFTTLAGAGTIPNTSAFLTLLALYVYNLSRLEASSTIGQVLLTSSAAAPVHTFAAGDLVLSDQPSGTSGANTYTNTTGGTLGPSSTLSVEFKAINPGAKANIATGTTLYLWTPLVGVAPTNPAYGTSSTWITTPGTDQESDARLAARCVGRWSQLTYGNTEGAYVAWSLAALPALTRVSVASAAGDGNVKVIGATAVGPLDAGQCTTILNYLNGTTDGIGRRPINDIVTVVGATTLSTPALAVDVYVRPDVVSTISAAVQTALLNYFGSIPIGGVQLVGGGTGIVPYSKIWQIVQDLDGVRKLALNISGDITLASDQIYAPTITVNVHQVSPGA